MAITRKWSAAPGSERKRKATFLLPIPLLRAIDDAVIGRVSSSKNTFVEAALDRAIEEWHREKRLVQLQAAMDDPLVRKDIDDVECDFRFADVATTHARV